MFESLDLVIQVLHMDLVQSLTGVAVYSLRCLLMHFCLSVYGIASAAISVRCIHGHTSTSRNQRMLLTSMRFSMAISLSMRRVRFQVLLFNAYAVDLQLEVSDEHSLLRSAYNLLVKLAQVKSD
jgi:hypothetical protein